MSTAAKAEVLPDFLKHVAEHQMTVLRDDGVHRCLRFAKPGTYCYSFYIITWPGYLCISGDCGDYVFQRLEDMFEFFRTKPRDTAPDELHINLSYWGEKLTAVCKTDGFKKFSSEKFEANVKQWFDEFFESHEASAEVKAECWAEIENDVLSADDNEVRKFDAAYEFKFEHPDLSQPFEFVDFFEANNEDYTWRFVWCCYAIAWAIKQYDASKPEVAKAAA